MRLIKNEKQLQLLSYMKIVDSKLINKVHNILMENKKKDNLFEGVLILEKGDLLRGVDILGIYSEIGGVIGIRYLSVEFFKGHAFATYLYNSKLVYLIINIEYCDEEILYYLNLYI